MHCGSTFYIERNQLKHGWGKYCSHSCAGRPGVRRVEAAIRFWDYVEKTGSGECWTWTGALWGGGYGCAWDGTKQTQAHRVAWELQNGPIPDGLDALHKCDNRSCVNPAHLFLGTDFDNMRDMVAKGRWRGRGGMRRRTDRELAKEQSK